MERVHLLLGPSEGLVRLPSRVPRAALGEEHEPPHVGQPDRVTVHLCSERGPRLAVGRVEGEEVQVLADDLSAVLVVMGEAVGEDVAGEEEIALVEGAGRLARASEEVSEHERGHVVLVRARVSMLGGGRAVDGG